MFRIAMRTLSWIARIFLASIVLVWLFLVLPFFSSQRAGIAETLLELDLGKPFEVNGDAKLYFGRTLRLVMTDVAIPGPTTESEDLATADVFELDIQLQNLMNNQITFDNLKLSGLALSFVTFPDGTSNWPDSSDSAEDRTGSAETGSDTTASQNSASKDDKPGLFDHTEVDISNSSVRIENRVSGFTFDLGVDELVFQRPQEGIANIDAKGTLNGQPLTIRGDYDANAPFSIAANIGETQLDFDGKPVEDADGRGITARLSSEIEEIENLLEVLRLEAALEGRASATVDIGIDGAIISAEQFNIVLDSDDGRQIKASGTIDNLVKLDGIEAKIDARLFPEGQEPSKATNIQDITVTGARIALEGSLDDLALKSVLVSTNAFDQGFEQIGQVSISQLHRTPEGLLEIKQIGLQAGPKDAPYLRAQGSIGDFLQFSDINFDGTVNMPASAILQLLGEDGARQFGVLDGTFRITGKGNRLSIEQFAVNVTDTDLWTFDIDLMLEKVRTVEGLEAKAEIGIDDTSRFLKALDLAPVAGEAVNLKLDITGENRSFDNKLAITTGTTRADVSLNALVEETGLIVRGGLSSDRVVVSDIKDAVAFLIQLGKQRNAEPEAKSTEPRVVSDERVPQPLVLTDGPEDQTSDQIDKRVAQPLVLPKENLSAARQQILSVDYLAARADVDFGIDIKQVAGGEDVSSVKSDLKVRDGKLSFGPLNIAHSGGYFNLSAAMNVIKAPGVVSINGTTGGWDLGKIMSSMGAGIGAQGVLAGRFSLSGSNASYKQFLNTMVGKADVSMGRGRIDTSLLDLAGLGLIPWLFSKDLRQGYTEVVCINAPVQINRGKITTSKSVLETEEVQLVAKGTIDVKNDTVSLRAEPRPVGRPLARSAVPIEVSGKLSDPKIDLQLGGERGARANGNTAMPSNREPCTPDIYQLR